MLGLPLGFAEDLDRDQVRAVHGADVLVACVPHREYVRARQTLLGDGARLRWVVDPRHLFRPEILRGRWLL